LDPDGEGRAPFPQIIFQMAEVAEPRELFQAILEGIGRLRLSAVNISASLIVCRASAAT
jgi:hypothetical protein